MPGEHLKAYLPVQLDVELLKTLEALAQLTGLSRVDYLQGLLENALRNQEVLMDQVSHGRVAEIRAQLSDSNRLLRTSTYRSMSKS